MSPDESPKQPPHHAPPRRPGAPPRRLRRLEPREPSGHGAATGPRPAPASRRHRWLIIGLRYVLPAVVVIAGIVAMSFGTDTALEGGAGIVGAGLAIWFVNWLFRIGATGDAERDAEERAREYFDRHGRWPDGN